MRHFLNDGVTRNSSNFPPKIHKTKLNMCITSMWAASLYENV